MTQSSKTIRVHIGTHKTGTTSIQQLLNQYSQAKNPAFLYPTSGRMVHWPIAHHQLLQQLRKNETADLKKMQSEVNESDQDICVISCEDFCLIQQVYSLHRLRDMFPDHKFELYLAFRPYIAWLESYYLEELKRNRTHLLPMEFFFEHWRNFRYSTILNNAQIIDADLYVFEYDKDGYFEDIFKALTGVVPNDNEERISWNKSYSAEMTFVLRDFFIRNSGQKLNIDRILHSAYQVDKIILSSLKKKTVYSNKDRKHIFDHFEEEHYAFGKSYNNIVSRLFAEPELIDDDFVLQIDENDMARNILHLLFKL